MNFGVYKVRAIDSRVLFWLRSLSDVLKKQVEGLLGSLQELLELFSLNFFLDIVLDRVILRLAFSNDRREVRNLFDGELDRERVRLGRAGLDSEHEEVVGESPHSLLIIEDLLQNLFDLVDHEIRENEHDRLILSCSLAQPRRQSAFPGN